MVLSTVSACLVHAGELQELPAVEPQAQVCSGHGAWGCSQGAGGGSRSAGRRQQELPCMDAQAGYCEGVWTEALWMAVRGQQHLS